LALGVLATLMGYGKIPMSKDPVKNEEYLQKIGKILRICGIIMIVAGLFLAVSKVFAP